MLSFNVLDTEASYNSDHLSDQWSQVKNDLIDLQDAFIGIGLNSQNLKDAIEQYQKFNTDFKSVSAAKYSLDDAKSRLFYALNNYYKHTQELEANGAYNFPTYPHKSPFYPNIYQPNQMSPSYYPGSINTDPDYYNYPTDTYPHMPNRFSSPLSDSTDGIPDLYT